MAERSDSTKWIVAGGALVTVIVVSVAVLVVALRGDDGTTALSGTTTTSVATTTTVAAPPSTDPEGPEEVQGLSEERVQIDAGGRTRTVLELVPDDLGPGADVPAVMVLHGLGVSAEAISRIADWREAVVRDRFVAVFPQGESNSWNLGPCCPPANLFGVDDTAFLDAVWERVGERGDVDPSRHYLTGFSNGGLMVYDYACRRSETLAAIAPMAGSNLTGCAPSRPLSLLHQHGDPDPVVPYDGGVGIGTLVSASAFPSVPESVAAWAEADGCDPDPVDTTDEVGIDRVETREWRNCAEGTRVELVRISGVGHEWARVPGYEPLDEVLGFFDIGPT